MHHSLPEVPGLTAASVDEDRPELPSVEGELPAAEGELPAVEGELPAVEGELPAAVVETPVLAAAVETPEPAAAVDEDRPAAALDEERPELAAVEGAVPELLCSAPPGREDGLTLAIQALARSVDNLAVAFNGMRPGSVAPSSVAPGSVVARVSWSSAEEATEMQGVWVVPGEARSWSQQAPLPVMGGGPWSGTGQRGEVPPADPGQAGASRRRIGRIGHGGGVQHRRSAGFTRPRREEGQVQEEKKVAAGSVQQGPQRWSRRPRP